MKQLSYILFIISLAHYSLGQGSFAPGVGHVGTTAMHKDSSSFVAWVSNCSVKRGYQQINDSTLGKASVGDSLEATGKADGRTVSLGDGGEALIVLSQTIFNGPGVDFAVFENGFSASFLELAFVEVSSNGVDFFRFPSTSQTQVSSQLGSFGAIDPTEINNLAGKYQVNYGTPFDLSDLPDTGLLNKYAISHIRIKDVVGNIMEPFSSKDQYGTVINDPWPTPFASSGFDLDAVGLIHVNGINSLSSFEKSPIVLFPNPVTNELRIKTSENILAVEFMDVSGKVQSYEGTKSMDVSRLEPGVYIVRVSTQNKVYVQKLVKR